MWVVILKLMTFPLIQATDLGKAFEERLKHFAGEGYKCGIIYSRDGFTSEVDSTFPLIQSTISQDGSNLMLNTWHNSKFCNKFTILFAPDIATINVMLNTISPVINSYKNSFFIVTHVEVSDVFASVDKFITKEFASPIFVLGIKGRTKQTHFEEYPLPKKDVIKIATFNHPPHNVVERDPVTGQTILGGIEPNIMKIIAKTSGLKLEYHTPRDGGTWGDIFANGTTTGLTRDVTEGVIDVGLAHFFLKAVRNEIMEPTDYYATDGYCFAMTKPKPLSKWTDLIRPYQLEAWMGILASIVVGIGFLLTFNRFIGPERYPPHEVVLFSYGGFVNQSRHVPIKNTPMRIFIGLYSLTFEIIALGFCGSLVSFLTVTSFPTPINTMAEVAEYPLPVAVVGITWKREFDSSPDPIHNAIGDKLFNVNGHLPGYNMASREESFFLTDKDSFEYKVRKLYTNKYGETNLRLLKECWNHFLISFYLPKNTRFQPLLDNKMLHLKESGIILKLKSDEMDKVARAASAKNVVIKDKKLSLTHVSAPFFMLLVGILLCLIVFAYEMGFRAFCKAKSSQ